MLCGRTRGSIGERLEYRLNVEQPLRTGLDVGQASFVSLSSEPRGRDSKSPRKIAEVRYLLGVIHAQMLPTHPGKELASSLAIFWQFAGRAIRDRRGRGPKYPSQHSSGYPPAPDVP